ncbi:poly [ADP-ribose] polymerase 14, partial [Biomphalaria glabrata]
GVLIKGNGLTLGSKQLTAKPVLKTNSILVNGLSENVTMSSVKTYLDNKELSGGGKIKCMQEIKEDKQVIVYFEPDV